MSLNSLILRNLKKNIKNYYLYVFALVFSVGLYFAFVTLRFDPSITSEIEGSAKGAAGLGAASTLLVVIVGFFLLYANNLFIKRRSKEIGLFQLIGLTKNEIFRLLTAENLLLYFGSMVIGIFAGFAASKLFLMVLFKVTGVKIEAKLTFSTEALIQTAAVFAAIYVLIMLMNYLFIRRQTILSLFRVRSSTEGKIGRLSILQMLIGLAGIVLIGYGYVLSTRLFSGSVDASRLANTMLLILGSVIVGTYLFYKGSVSFIFYLIRKSKGGYLTVKEVLSLSSIMFRMKSNALLLTIITTVSALAIGMLSLAYITYYSADKDAAASEPNDFSIAARPDMEKFLQGLDERNIPYTEIRREVLKAEVDLTDVIGSPASVLANNSPETVLPVVSDTQAGIRDVAPDEVLFTGFADGVRRIIDLRSSGDIVMKGKSETVPLQVIGLDKETVVSWYFVNGGLPTAVVDETVFQRLKADLDPAIQTKYSVYNAVSITDRDRLEEADDLFHELGLSGKKEDFSQRELARGQKASMGMNMFVVGFLGLAFLITSGCILYFKQMDEGEDERPNYTILRKLGFTQGNLLGGIQLKQLFNFGIPLVVGLLHSYFAVQSGWFFFGTEQWMPMFIVMLLYTALYSIFGFLTVLFYKRIVREAL
ncbi:ABC transporter permease [Paenibacillus sp. CN-4]|uniref:ABC transporter permease n=1 Tax=Paenibacillus nanchangensis TaxID=3348343 RepID=UPI00397C7848